MIKAIDSMNDNKNLTAEEIVLDVMRHFGFRRNYQVAEYFEVTPQTLSGWIKSGEIPPKHLLKFNSEVLAHEKENYTTLNKGNNLEIHNKKKNSDSHDNSWYRLNYFFFKNLKTIVFIPLFLVIVVGLNVFFVQDNIYTSKSKVLPVSDSGGSTNAFSGFASQLGVNFPLNIGGKVPWAEIYPEILKSSDLLESILTRKYLTDKYGYQFLSYILLKHYKLEKFVEQEQKNRMIDKLRQMINVSKDRSSPIVNINVEAFEPKFAAELSKDLIESSSLIQRKLKTSRIRQKRLFIEERLAQVLLEMNKMEEDLRIFRESNRNLSSSPSLQMKVQEMGRERDLQNSLYVTLKTQYEKAKIDEIGREEMVQQIDGPSIPTELTKPRRALSIVLASFFGFFISIFFVYLKETISI